MASTEVACLRSSFLGKGAPHIFDYPRTVADTPFHRSGNNSASAENESSECRRLRTERPVWGLCDQVEDEMIALPISPGAALPGQATPVGTLPWQMTMHQVRQPSATHPAGSRSSLPHRKGLLAGTFGQVFVRAWHSHSGTGKFDITAASQVASTLRIELGVASGRTLHRGWRSVPLGYISGSSSSGGPKSPYLAGGTRRHSSTT